uniref:Lysophospholipase l1-like esterase n=2 Tax=Tetraselmis sp. GSL018 TaxID=582737 RepID=A0A061S722_9CHLO|mmetsp:Transcript_1066/g.2562  ORF Transcript_1066/g.2562 Transcript_1066/m.2562 type:complete len:223 (-) Transcript_1066:144-812(-)
MRCLSKTETKVFGTVPRFEREIQHMLKQPQQPLQDAVVMVGSSIFREWQNAPEHLGPLPVINRAFGGSTTADQLDRIDQVLIPLAPRVVLYYCGSNDINAGESPAAISANFAEFCERLWAHHPRARVVFVSIIKCPQKAGVLGAVDEANAAVEAHCRGHRRLRFFDLNPWLHEEDGATPRHSLYRDDMLHFRPHAYAEVLAPAIRPVLRQEWEEAAGPRSAL